MLTHCVKRISEPGEVKTDFPQRNTPTNEVSEGILSGGKLKIRYLLERLRTGVRRLVANSVKV